MSRGILERLPLGPTCQHTKVILTDYTVKRLCSRGAAVHTGEGEVLCFGAGR